jgi:Zn2+/Cd2+-exporting ATPase
LTPASIIVWAVAWADWADVALMAHNLGTLPLAAGMSRATRAVTYQNLAIALGVVIGLLIVASGFGVVSIGPAIILHAGSTIVVVLNAQRLLTYRE